MSRNYTFLDGTRKRVLLIYASILAVGIAYSVAIHIRGFGFPCYFREITGYSCPGCGSTRMMLSVLNLDFITAIKFNPVAFFAFGFWIIVSILAFIGKPAKMRDSKFLLNCLYVTIGFYVIQCIIRNIFFPI